MNDWDEVDNDSKTKRCAKCGNDAHCITTSGTVDAFGEKMLACNHCYDIVTSGSTCKDYIVEGSKECRKCRFLDEEKEGIDCDNFEDCTYCDSLNTCAEAY